MDRTWLGWRVAGQLDPAGRPAVALWWHLVNAASSAVEVLCGAPVPPAGRMRFTGPRAPGTSCGFCEAVYSGNPTR